jgi:hypothetical protein
MSKLTARQIASLLKQQGFAPDKIPLMTAIGLAESSGNPNAFNDNPNTGDKSLGIFQINTYGALGPARIKEFGLKSREELFDPTVNARAAKRILESQGLGAWSVYKGGQYKKFLPEAQQAFSSLGQQPQQQPQTPAQQQPQQRPQDVQIVRNIFLGGLPYQDSATNPYSKMFLDDYTNRLVSGRLNIQDLLGMSKEESMSDRVGKILSHKPNYLDDPYLSDLVYRDRASSRPFPFQV